MTVDGAVVLVTGGAGGIGASAARLFARDGAEVVVIADVKDASETVDAVRAVGAKAEWVNADLAEEDTVQAVIDKVVVDHGRLDTAFNNAGITGFMTTFHELEKDVWDRMLAVNLTSVFLCMKHELAHMVERGGGGAIVNTSSGAGVYGFPGLPHYVAAKHGVLGLTKVVALETAEVDITCNAICPGYVATPLVEGQIEEQAKAHGMSRERVITEVILAAQPSKRFVAVEELGALTVFLCSPAGRSITGAALPVDGGWTAR
jgi:3-hydroxybutyrate dehydrogenase